MSAFCCAKSGVHHNMRIVFSGTVHQRLKSCPRPPPHVPPASAWQVLRPTLRKARKARSRYSGSCESETMRPQNNFLAKGPRPQAFTASLQISHDRQVASAMSLTRFKPQNAWGAPNAVFSLAHHAVHSPHPCFAPPPAQA